MVRTIRSTRPAQALRAPLHRALRRLHFTPARAAGSVLLAFVFTVLLALAQPQLARMWSAQLIGWMRALQVPGHFTPADLGKASITLIPVPWVAARPVASSPPALRMHAAAAVALWVAVSWLPDRARPIAYLLRLVALVHAASIAYFSLWPASFPHSTVSHVQDGLRQVWILMLLMPWLHLVIHYLLSFAWWKGIALTSITLVFLATLAPLLYALHAATLQRLGLVAMPLLHMLFGVVVPVVGCVALYAWAMSWRDASTCR